MADAFSDTPETEVNAAAETETASNPEESNDDKYQALHAQHLRLAADFENYRKRQSQEREHLFKYGAQTTLEALLPVLDNLERAKQGLSETSDAKMLYKSFDMLATQLLDSLKQAGLEKMAPKGELFNPERHEAINQVENADVPDHTILEVYQPGYILRDKVLRPAQVVVAIMPHTTTPIGVDFDPADANQNNPFQAAGAAQGSEAE